MSLEKRNTVSCKDTMQLLPILGLHIVIHLAQCYQLLSVGDNHVNPILIELLNIRERAF